MRHPTDDAMDVLHIWQPFLNDIGSGVPEEKWPDMALVLQTQVKVNEQHNCDSHAFMRCSVPVLLRAFIADNEILCGLVDWSDCCDAIQLGPNNPPADYTQEPAWTIDLTERLKTAIAKLKQDNEFIYFGGLVASKGLIYLLIGV